MVKTAVGDLKLEEVQNTDFDLKCSLRCTSFCSFLLILRVAVRHFFLGGVAARFHDPVLFGAVFTTCFFVVSAILFFC